MKNDVRPDPPPGARNLVLLVLDSLRYDTLMAARLQVLPRLGPVHRRFSYASWTSPSHFNLLMGLLPHPSPTHVVASTWYRQGYAEWAHRLGIPELSFLGMLPQLWLPEYLRTHLGYLTRAVVSMPVLNPATPINCGFDSYTSAPQHNNLRAIVRGLEWDADRPTFQLINTGETHYPYATPDEPEHTWPRLHGVHGIFKDMGRPIRADEGARIFDAHKLDALRARQLFATRYLDGVIAELLDSVPENTWVIVTSDHGELFGEDGYFGHGPIQHIKVFEVPLIEGLAR